jgi:uridine nucleosidase
MGQDGHQIRRHKLIIDTDPGIGASPLLIQFNSSSIASVPSIVAFA